MSDAEVAYPAADSVCSYEDCQRPAWRSCPEGRCLYHSPSNGNSPETARLVWQKARQMAADKDAEVCDFDGWHFPADPDKRYEGGREVKGFAGFRFEKPVSFQGATFSGDAWFNGATFSGDASFEGATFSGLAWFASAAFNGNARFDDATFSGTAWFSNAKFNGEAWFGGATFSGNAWFRDAAFSGDAGFEWAKFGWEARFNGATFTGDAGFLGATFRGDAMFADTTFNGDAMFDGSTFDADAGFDGTMFNREARFEGATFSGDAWFRWATFSGEAQFTGTTFSGVAWFEEATFNGKAEFLGAMFDGSAVFKGATFNNSAVFRGARFSGNTGFKGATFGGDALFAGARFEPGTIVWFDSPSWQWRPFTRYPFAQRRYGEQAYRFAKQVAQERGHYTEAGRYHYAEQCAIEDKWRSDSKHKPWRKAFWVWLLGRLLFGRLIYGYGERPRQPLLAAFVVIALWTGFYCLGDAIVPSDPGLEPAARAAYEPSVGECLYCSIVTFTTLGYGDYQPKEPYRLLAASEALLGAALMAVFIVCLSKKYIR